MNAEEAIAIVNKVARDELIDELLVEVLRSPSPQTEALEADPAIREFVAAKIAPRIEALTGARPKVDAMGNLLWRHGPSAPPRPGLLLMAYAMTFPAASMADPFSGAIVSGQAFGLTGPCAWGRGACEQKGALAGMIAAAAMVIQSGASLRRPFHLVVSLAGETGRHDAADFILEHSPIAARHGIVGLGTCNRVCLGNKGRLDMEIVVRGKSSHSSTPWEGVNAIDGARRVMDRLDGLVPESSHPHLGRSTLTLTGIESSPRISHTVPDLCRLTLDRRLLPTEDPDRAFETISQALSGLDPWHVRVERGPFMYPSEVSSGCDVARALKAACALLGADGEPFYSHAALDAGFLNRKGIETVMFGPGDLRFAHTDQEVVALTEVRLAARVYAAATFQLLT